MRDGHDLVDAGGEARYVPAVEANLRCVEGLALGEREVLAKRVEESQVVLEVVDPRDVVTKLDERLVVLLELLEARFLAADLLKLVLKHPVDDGNGDEGNNELVDRPKERNILEDEDTEQSRGDQESVEAEELPRRVGAQHPVLVRQRCGEHEIEVPAELSRRDERDDDRSESDESEYLKAARRARFRQETEDQKPHEPYRVERQVPRENVNTQPSVPHALELPEWAHQDEHC